MSSRPVFFDPTQRRAAHLSRIALLIGLLAAAALTVFWASVIAAPIGRKPLLLRPRFAADARFAAAPPHPATPKTRGRRQMVVASKSIADGGGVVAGFYVSWNEVSLASLRLHARDLTHLFPQWLHLRADGAGFDDSSHDRTDAEALALARQNHVAVLPMLDNVAIESGGFQNARLHTLLIDPKRRATVVAQLKRYLLTNRFQGVNLDFETDSDDDRALLADFSAEVARALHPAGLLVTQDVQVGDDAAETTGEIARSCDFVVPMLYDFHYSGGTSGPIAPARWVNDRLDALLKTTPASKIVLAIGNFAYDWRANQPGARSMTFGEAMATARESADGETAGIVRMDAASGNPTFTYSEDGVDHAVWFLDAVTGYNLVRDAARRGITGRALWYVGSEDPSLWTFFSRGKTASDPSALAEVRYGFEIDFEGEGEILDVASLPQPGHRLTKVGGDGRIASERFSDYPTACLVRRTGRAEKTVALTFDDGPDPVWTPRILDALGDAKVPGTFFVIGSLAEQRPDLLKRIWESGSDIGNHSFYHPNLSTISPTRVRLELDATQRAIQAAIGRTTPLFRPPYGIDSEPSTTEEVIPLEAAQQLGYVTVGEGIDPRDWETVHRLTAPQIADNIVAGVTSGKGAIVLLHDGGGDRTTTAEAIPIAVRRLQAKGYRFVTISGLLGQKSRDALFPPLTGRERLMALVDRGVFAASSGAGRFLGFLFLFSLVAGTLRLASVALLALRHACDERGLVRLAVPASGWPSVSVVIAAYNEEKVIARTVRALLAGNYPRLEVIVVDDGSKDATAEVVRSGFGDDPRVRVLVKANGGKASALNLGIAAATGDVLVGLDADTLFATDTVHRLARHFADDPTVSAVAGNVRVGNRTVNLLTRWQAVEYTTSQNFDRRAYAVLNGIPVVPGAIGAWRASVVRAVGGYATDTLAEDADLTWRVRRAGGRILSDSTALAFTEAPDRLPDLLKQRFRWTFGTLQTLWKHRDLLFRPRYGAFGMLVAPALWLFQVVLPLASPAADIGVLLAALGGNLVAAACYFTFFSIVEFSAAWLAYALERRTTVPAARRDLIWLFAQRIAYRYLLFWVLWRALRTALRGSRAGWGKLERRGTVAVGS